MFKRSLFALCILALVIAGCAQAAAPQSKEMDNYGGRQVLPQAPMEAPAPAPAFSGQEESAAYDAAGNIVQPADRLVIQNADLTIVVDEPPAAMEAISRLAVNLGGFVVTSNQYKTTTDNDIEVTQGQMTIREGGRTVGAGVVTAVAE